MLLTNKQTNNAAKNITSFVKELMKYSVDQRYVSHPQLY